MKPLSRRDLRHRLEHLITRQPTEYPYWDYDEWSMYGDIELFKDALTLIYETLTKSDLEFSHLAALGGSGIPLAMGLSLEYFEAGDKKCFFVASDPVVGISSEWIRPIKPEISFDGQRVILVDTEIKSGHTAWDAYRKIDKLGGKVVGIVAITDYIHFPDRKEFERLTQRDKIKVIKLFNFDPINNILEEA